MKDTVLVIGATDVGRRTCAELQSHGRNVIHLDAPTDAELHDYLIDDVGGVAVMLHSDIEALRYSLAIEHIRPGVRLFAAIFDRTVRHEIERVIPNCFVASPAFIALPHVVASALDIGSAVIRTTTGDDAHWKLVNLNNDVATSSDFEAPRGWRWRTWWSRVRGQLRAYDFGSKALLNGFYALTSILIVDLMISHQHASLAESFYDSSATLAGVTAPPAPGQTWHLILNGTFMLLTLVFTAIFGAGIVNHLLSGRRVGIVGRRVIPASQHFVVVGLGQVGIRLCRELSLLGIAVVGVDSAINTRGLSLARRMNIPVIVGDPSDVKTLTRAHGHRAQGILAMSAEERDNIAVAVAARAMSPDVTIMLRAGSDDAIAETQSLFSIGKTIDVNGLTATYVSAALSTDTPLAVVPDGSEVLIVAHDMEVTRAPIPGRCACN